MTLSERNNSDAIYHRRHSDKVELRNAAANPLEDLNQSPRPCLRMFKPTMSSEIIATARWEMLSFNLFLRRDRKEREKEREREREKSAPRDAPRESNNWSFQFLALRLTPDASPSIATDWYNRYIARVCIRTYVSERVCGLRHRRHILNVNMPRSIHRPVNRVTRSKK